MSGLQCLKRLYLECYQRNLADPLSKAQKSILDSGIQIGKLARDLYPGGILITHDYMHSDNALESTRMALSDSTVPAIHEAAFEYDGILIRTDIMVRVDGDTFDLIEVKSGTRAKEEHLSDVSIQVYVIRGCGITVRRAYIGLLDKNYIYQGGNYDLQQLFCLRDITQDVERLQVDIPSSVDTMKFALCELEPPDIKARKQCSQPYPCPFYTHCHNGEPDHHISQLPRAKQELLQSLEEAGIDDIRHIPPDFPFLNATQQRVRDCVVNNRVYIEPHISIALRQLSYPIHFLDFETFNPALPLYTGTHPYQMIPFQWSNHIMTRDGQLKHDEFLYDEFDDPREPFARSLIRTLGNSGSILVYSSFEATLIRELAVTLPHLSEELMALLDGRIVDLLQLIRNHCYHPDFHGSFSLKSVLPALVPHLGYSDLEISDGGQASVAYAEMISPNTTPERRNSLRENLLAYCERDTEAEVRLFETLRNHKSSRIRG